MADCSNRDKVFKRSEASTKAFMRTIGVIDEYLNIIDLPGFRKQNTKWSNYARQQYKTEGRLFYEENNGTKAVPNKELFKKIDNAKGIYYQESATEVSPIEGLEKQMLNFFEKAGITVKQLDTIKDSEGNELSIVARSKIFERLIEVVNSKKDITTMPEEASHFLVEMLGDNHLLVKSMMRDITSKQIYLDTLNEYKELYQGDTEKIKKEAIGKLIALHIVAKYQGKEVDEKYVKEIKDTKGWFDRLMQVIKDFLKHINVFKLNNLTKAYNAYNRSAEMILGEEVGEFNEPTSLSYAQIEEGVKYTLRLVNGLQKIQRNIFKSNVLQGWINDLQKQGVPKEQIDMFKDSAQEGMTKDEILSSILANYSYSVEVNIAKGVGEAFTNRFGEQDAMVPLDWKPEDDNRVNSSYYSNLSAPGGTGRNKYEGNPDWEYQELEFKTPLITPSIKGHAQFATDQGIGWVRVWYNKKTGVVEIQEIQSDLFQKGRDKVDLVNNDLADSRASNIHEDDFRTNIVLGKDGFTYVADVYENIFYKIKRKDNSEYSVQGYNIIEDTYKEITREEFIKNTSNVDTSKENQFLQLLNKDNNWVTFFIKSIIQDSTKKGYEKVLFPKGETSAKIEGHETINEIKQKLNNNITFAEKIVSNPETAYYEDIEGYSYEYLTEDMSQGFLQYFPNEIRHGDKDIFIKLVKEQIENFKKEIDNLYNFKPIEAFYEIKVGNILEKQFGKDNVKTITDEYGNQWREIEIKPERDLQNFFLQKSNKGEYYQASEKPNQSTLIKSIQDLQDKIVITTTTDKEGNEVRDYVVNGKLGYTSASTVSKKWAAGRLGKLTPTEEEKKKWTKLAEIGTLNHTINAEVIRRAFPSVNTHLEPTNEEFNKYYSKLISYAQTSLSKLIKETQLNGGVLMAEVKIANTGTMKAGTMDLLRVNKDGSVDLFDYKTRNKNELSYLKLQEYTVQMHEYVNLLEKGDPTLGIVPTKVNQRRIIQIKSKFNNKFEFIGFHYLTEETDKEELQYQPLISERTGVKKLDNLIDKLTNQIKIEEGNLRSTGDKVKKQEIVQSIKTKQELVKSLQIKKDIKVIIDSAERDLDIIESSIEDGEYDPKVNYLDYLDVTRLYASINEFIPEEVRKELTDEDEKKFDALAGKSVRLIDQILALGQEDLKVVAKKHDLIGKGDITSADALLDPDKEIGFMERFLYGVSSTSNKLIALVKKMTDDALFKSRNKSTELKDKLAVSIEKLRDKFGKKGIDIFDPFLQRRKDGSLTGNLVNEILPEFWIERKKAITDNDNAWLLENTEFDEEGYTRGLNYFKEYQKNNAKTIYFEKYKQAKKSHPDQNDANWKALAKTWTDLEINKNIAEWESKHRRLDVYNKAKLDKWKDPRYDAIQKDATLKEFYDLFRDTIEEVREFLPMDINKNFIPNFTAKFVELSHRVGFKEALKHTKDDFLQSLDAKSNEQYYGVFSTYTGEPLNSIPVFGTQHLKDSEGNIVDATVKSYDLGQVLFLFAESAYRYKELEAIHHTVLEAKEALKNQQTYDTDSLGNPKMINGAIQYRKRTSDDATIAQMQDFIDTVFYSKQRKSEGKIAAWGDKLLKYTALKNLAFNVFSPSVNVLQGQSTALITGAIGKYYSMKDYAWASAAVTTGPAGLGENAKLVNKLTKYMDITFHEFTKEQAEELSQLKGKKIKSELGFKLQEWGDDLVQNSILIAMLKSNKFELKISDFKVNDKDELEYIGKLSSEQYQEALKIFKEKTKKVSKKVVGNYDSDDRMAAKRWFLGRALMQHRTWLPAMFESRFSSKKYDYVLDEWFEGRYRMYAKKAGWQILKAYAKRGFIFAKAENIIEEGFSRDDVYNMKANLMELYLIAGIWLLTKALSAGDDDDEQSIFEKYIVKTGNRLVSELTFFMWPGSAIDILISPAASVSTVQDIGKLMSHTYNEVYGQMVDDEELIKKATPGRQVKKLFPVINQVQRVEETLFEQTEKK